MSNNNNNKRSFSLSTIGRSIKNRYSELSHNSEPNSKSIDSQVQSGPSGTTFEQEDYDRTEAPKDDMQKYWRQFETTPIVRKPITSFASSVVKPGYYFEYPEELEDDEDLKRKMRHFAQSCAIIEGEVNQDWIQLGRKAVVQNEVRGTMLTEIVPDKNDSDSISAFKLINAETMEVVTRPNQAILLAPDDNRNLDLEDVPETEKGEAAAYLQDIYETRNSFLSGQARRNTDDGVNKIPFTREEVIKMTRDADAGEIFGTSRIEAVSDRIDGIKQKLSDHDEAIASKAYPLWLFMFGDPQSDAGVWEADDINQFMKSHEMSNFHPGMKQGVRGDVSVETISGEVADIAESLQFDVNWIITAMPMPKYALGGFAESVGQVAGIAQQQDVQQQIQDMRNELGNKFTPAFQKKAMEFGVSESLARDIKFRVGRKGEPDNPNVNQNIIRYIGKDDNDARGDPLRRGDKDDIPSEDDDTEASSESSDRQTLVDRDERLGQAVWNENNSYSVAQLSALSTNESRLADLVAEVAIGARNEVLAELDDGDPRGYESVANLAVSRRLNKSSFRREVRDAIEEELAPVYDEYGQSGRSNYSREMNTGFFAQNVRNAIDDFVDEMMRKVRVQMRHAFAESESVDAIDARVRAVYDDTTIRNRASIISKMELREARESAKLQLFEQRDDIVGVQFSNESPSEEPCSTLAGETFLFEDGDIGAQFNNVASAHSNEFDPMPRVPPMHFGCKSTLEPVYDDT